jgi:hypothetical protein
MSLFEPLVKKLPELKKPSLEDNIRDMDQPLPLGFEKP